MRLKAIFMKLVELGIQNTIVYCYTIIAKEITGDCLKGVGSHASFKKSCKLCITPISRQIVFNFGRLFGKTFSKDSI